MKDNNIEELLRQAKPAVKDDPAFLRLVPVLIIIVAVILLVISWRSRRKARRRRR